MKLRNKSVSEILTSMFTWIHTNTNKVFDYSPGTVIRTLLEAISLQLEEFYYDVKQNVTYAISNSVFNSFGFTRITDTKATGKVTLTFTTSLPSSLLIAKGTMFSTSSIQSNVLYFETIDDVIVPANTVSIDLYVQCTENGAIGNIASGEICNIITGNRYFSSVTNSKAFTSGTSAETDLEQQNRFKEYLKSIGKGTRDAIIYGCKEVEGVSDVYIDDEYIGYVKAYVCDSDGNLSDELKSKVLKNLDDYRPGGIEIDVLPPVQVPVDINLTIVTKDTVDVSSVTALVTDTIRKYLYSFKMCNSSFQYNNIVLAISDLANTDILSCYLENVTKVITLQNNQRLVPGNIVVNGYTLTEWGELNE